MAISGIGDIVHRHSSFSRSQAGGVSRVGEDDVPPSLRGRGSDQDGPVPGVDDFADAFYGMGDFSEFFEFGAGRYDIGVEVFSPEAGEGFEGSGARSVGIGRKEL